MTELTPLQRQARVFNGQRRRDALAEMTYEELHQLFQFTRSFTPLDRAIRCEFHARAAYA